MDASLTGLTRIAAGSEAGGAPSGACDHSTPAIDFDLAALHGSIAALARSMRDELETGRFFEGVSSRVRRLIPHDRLVLACLEEGGHTLSVFGQHAAGGPVRHESLDSTPPEVRFATTAGTTPSPVIPAAATRVPRLATRACLPDSPSSYVTAKRILG